MAAGRRNLNCRRTSSQSTEYYEPECSFETAQEVDQELAELLSHPALERQNSVEYLDTPSLQDEGRGSTPDLTDSPAKKAKKKKKRHFGGVFHRHKDRHKTPLDGRLGDSLPEGSSPFFNGTDMAEPETSTHLSLESTWLHGQWKGLDSERKAISTHSSNTSLLSESDHSYRDLSEEELADYLVHPPGKDSFQATSPVDDAEKSEPAAILGYLVSVTLMSGHDLAIRDRTGTSDPYVKFKCPPFKYRSAVVHRNLNPEWNEHFSFQVPHLKTPVLVRVYDHDYGSLDDYMGGQTLELASYSDGEQHIVDLGLVDPQIKNEKLGFIRLYVKITPVCEVERPDSQKEFKKQKSCGSKMWSSVLTVTLLEGNNLPIMDQNGLCDPYCKFKLGSQKYKSKVLAKTLNPQWRQRFDLRMYDDCSVLHIEMWDRDFPQNDDFIGTCFVDLTTLSRNVTHDFTLSLMNSENEEVKDGECTLHFNLCITGTRLKEDGETEKDKLVKGSGGYGLLRSLDLKAIKEQNVGHLLLRIDKVVDLVTCNSYVMVELGNTCVKTRPLKSSSPTWDQTFEFTVGDIHEELEVKVYKISSRQSEHLLGMIKIPLHRLISRDGSHQFALKDKHCLTRTRGILHMDTDLVYNPVRAMIRTVNPREGKLLEDEQKFKKKVLLDNIKRVSNLVNTIIATVQFINSTWSWENKPLSAASFFIFLVVTCFGQLWMLLFGCVLVFLYQYVAIYIRREHLWQNRPSSTVHQVSSLNKAASFDHEDSDLSDSVEDKSTSLREKLRLFRSILLIVQKYLGYIADVEEGLRNLLNWQVPFLGWMAVLIFMAGTVLFYIIPVRYVVLVWGINKYTKRLRKPNFISNNELLDFLSRCPSNRQLQEWQELPLVVHYKPSKQPPPKSPRALRSHGSVKKTSSKKHQ